MKSKSPSWSYRKFISARAFRGLSINEHEDTGKGMVQLDQGDYEGSVREIQYFDKAATRRTVFIQKERRIVPVDHLAGTGVVRVEKVENLHLSTDLFIGPLRDPR